MTIGFPRESRLGAWSRDMRDLTKLLLVCVFLTGLLGCGTTKSYTATEQLLMSDAVDATVAKIDFEPLGGKKVYLDSTYLKTVKTTQIIDSDYVISSLRQKMVAAGVFLVDNRADAELIAEARMGALGLDGHNVTYGLPATNVLSSATTVLGGGALIPAIPEISLARHEAKTGAAKLAVFAYKRENFEPYWQSGLARSSSDARDTWFLGVGPWQRGTIYDGTSFAGKRMSLVPKTSVRQTDRFEDYRSPQLFTAAIKEHEPVVESMSDLEEDVQKIDGAEVQLASGEEATSEADTEPVKQ
ncbi:MAG: hypothetical protein KDB03_08300 [Planctomycetales bacterium]|nr:hypothetical protein [Planctomycetales bacterium]